MTVSLHFATSQVFEMDYRSGVGTRTSATADTPGTCHSQEATYPRKPHHSPFRNTTNLTY